MKGFIFLGFIVFAAGILLHFYLTISRGGDEIATSYTLAEPLNDAELTRLREISEIEFGLNCTDQATEDAKCSTWVKMGMSISTNQRNGRNFLRISSDPVYPFFVGRGRVPVEHIRAEGVIAERFAEKIISVRYIRRR